MATKIKVARSTVTGRKAPAGGTADDFGEISANIADRKIYVRDATGVPRLLTQGVAAFSSALIYDLGDLTIEANQLYLCTNPVTVPAPFDPADWTLLGGGGGGSLDGAVILAPTVALRNRIITAPVASGLVIEGDPAQTADLLVVEGTALSDTDRWAIDALGFPNSRAGAVVWRQAEPTHAFTARGQPAAFDGARWVPAEADVATGAALALVQQIIDANTLVLRSGGRITNLQAAAFAGGVITPGTTYYVSKDVAGQLSPVEPTSGRSDPVLVAITATTGVVITGAGRDIVQAPPPSVVGPTAPAAPRLGDLWYQTTVDKGMKVWRDDESIGEWVPVVEDPVIPPATHIGDTAPASPQPGQLWFRTLAPVGLFVWINDGDSSQWVQTQGGGSFLQAGRQNVPATGLLSVNLDQVPVGFSELAILFNAVTPPNATINFDFAGTVGAQYAHTRGVISGTAVATAGGEADTVYPIDGGNTASSTYMGTLFLNRFDGQAFMVSGNLRRGNTVIFNYAGRCILNNPAGAHFPRVNCNLGGFTSGTIAGSWKM